MAKGMELVLGFFRNSFFQKMCQNNLQNIIRLNTKGVRGNVEDMRVHYPKGYTLRVYHDKNWEENPEQMRHLCKVYCDHRDVVDLCPVRKLTLRIPAAAAYSERPLLPKFGMLWRFSPIADPLVAEFHSRDLDSRPTEREWAAVEEWLRSNRTFHVMRDHYSHKVAMLGGLWGMRLTQGGNSRGFKKGSKIEAA